VAADAEAHRADARAADVASSREEVEGRLGVARHLAGVELAEELHALLHAGVVVAELDARTGAMEIVGCERHEALAGDPLGHAADVRVDAEDLHEDDHAGKRVAARGSGQVAAHLAAAGEGDSYAFGVEGHRVAPCGVWGVGCG